MLPETVMQNGQNLPRHFDVILGHVDRFETDQKALTPAPAGTAAPTGLATAMASPGTSQTELIRVFYAVLYPDFTHTGGILANCRDEDIYPAEMPIHTVPGSPEGPCDSRSTIALIAPILARVGLISGRRCDAGCADGLLAAHVPPPPSRDTGEQRDPKEAAA